MIFSNIRLLVENFDQCFKFYAEILGLPVAWGKIGGDYASFDIGLSSNEMGLSIFKSDLMAHAVGNYEKTLPTNSREKIAIIMKVEDVDQCYEKLSEQGVPFVNEPTDRTGWGMRAAHLRDPEGNLIEIWSELAREKWDKDLLDEADEYGIK